MLHEQDLIKQNAVPIEITMRTKPGVVCAPIIMIITKITIIRKIVRREQFSCENFSRRALTEIMTILTYRQRQTGRQLFLQIISS